MKRLEILKTGRHTAINGYNKDFTVSDLIEMAKVYDPHLYKAPLVIGHPSLAAPAYGYVQSLEYSEGKLLAEPAQVDPAFAALVNSGGTYLSLSASFYLPDSAGNPRPGSFYLRHVGFLGAVAPAVKGLEAPAFSDGGQGAIEFGGFPPGFIPDMTRYV